MTDFSKKARWFEALSARRLSTPVRYLLPVIGVVVALLCQSLLAWILGKGTRFPFEFLYLIAIFITAWYGAYIPGVIGCALTMVGLPYLATPGFKLSSLDLPRFCLLAGVSLLISAVAEAQRRRHGALQHARDELDLKVRERTRELSQAVEALQGEIERHRHTESKLQSQLARLHLLDQITRAIGERQDLRSIFQVAIRTLEDQLPIDFACVCLYEVGNEEITVTCVGVRSEPFAMDLAMTQNARIPIDQNGLSRCLKGQLVYERDVREIGFPFPQRLAHGGLRAMVAAPLQLESQVFGVLITARCEPDSFSSTDCEFLRQLSEHVALAAHQAQVHDALRQAYDELRHSQQAVMQQERLRALGQMASGIAHDINNAISPIALYTELLLEQEPGLTARTRQYLEIAQRAIGDVAHTVSRMREFYRPREAEMVMTAVDLSALVTQVLDLTRARWSDMPQQRGLFIDLRTELAPDLPAIAGVESEIREALTNLVFNAVDAMPEGGILAVRTKLVESVASKSRLVQVEVADGGIGMDEETRRRCVEPFFTTKGERGTGLGLAMTYGIAQRHSADLEIESEQGKGTTVRMIFPVQSAEAPAAAAAPGALPARLRILSVDDDPVLIKSLRDVLEADGHAVTSAHGGQEGIDLFRSAMERNEQFGLVITDLGMPYVDGSKVASAVKSKSPSTPVILLTGWGERLTAEGDVPPYVDRVLNKPPKLRELRAALIDLAKQSGGQ